MKSRLWSAFLFVSVFGVGALTVWYFWNAKTPHAEASNSEAPAEEPTSSGIVNLPPEKVTAAGIQTTTVAKRPMRLTRSVPGRIQYDDTRHIEVKAATTGALIDVKVKPGDPVTSGQVLAILSSPEVGTARADVLQRVSELKLAQADLDWANTTADGLKTLVEAVQARKTVDQIRASLKDKAVGKSRETMLSAYSRYLLTDALVKSLASVGSNGALSGRQVAERQNEYESAEAALQATSEQETYDARRTVNQAKNAVELAQNKLKISQQHLITLLGYDDAEMTNSEAAELKNLSHVEVRAPFTGTIERKVYSNSERVQLGDSLFTLADTTQMWVAADLREGEWSAMSLHAGDPILVSTPAIPDRELKASVYYIGREVSPETNSVPLMATIDNASGLLRPGLFVRVQLPLTETHEAVAVPDSAVCEHESRSFVFIEEQSGSYKQVFIERGVQEGPWAEVKSGLNGGETVVEQGAFVLKSELLLEREE